MRSFPFLPLAALHLLACPPVAPHELITSPSIETPIARATRWALGDGARAPRPRTADAYLLILPADRPIAEARPVADQCTAAASFLRAPPGDPRFFFAYDGRVVVRDLDTGNLGPTAPVETGAVSLHIEHLLGFLAAASPLRLLVTAQVVKQQQQSVSPDLWLLTLDDRAHATAEQVSDDNPAFRDEAAFFSAFFVPRCLAAGRRCLSVEEVAAGQIDLNLKPERGSKPQKIEAFGDLDVRDAGWASGDGSQLYLLVGCPPQG